MKIIKTSEALPKSGRYVLAWLEGAKIPMRAMWADQHTLPLGDDADPEWGEYSEEKDEYFCPAGWYEMNQHEEQHWGVSGNVVAWCELPRLHDQFVAHIELAGAAPAAVAPQGDYPQLPEAAVWSVAGEDGMPTLGKGWMFSPVQQGNATLPLFTARQMWAYYDLGRQPAAVAGPAWDKTRRDLAIVMMGFAGNPSRSLEVAEIVLDAATEPGAPMAYLRAPAAPALEAPAAPTQDMESEQCRCEPSDWSPPSGYDGDGSVAAMARAALAAAPQAPAKGLPYEPTSDMLIAGRACDPALPVDTVRAIWWAMWRTAPQAPAAPVGESYAYEVHAPDEPALGTILIYKKDLESYVGDGWVVKHTLRADTAAPAAPSTHAGLMAAASHIQTKAQAHLDERGSHDPETGAVEMSESNQEHFNTLEELAEEIRLMADKAAPASCDRPPAGWAVRAHWARRPCAAAPAAPAVDAAGVLLTVIQRLNQNPYSLTKSECISEVEDMRDAALAAQAKEGGEA